MSRQGLQHAPGDIRAGGIEHGVVICKRHLAEEFPVVVGIECGPAAVARLASPAANPDRACVAACWAAGLPARTSLQRQHHHGGIVDIRIELVGVLEGPAGGLGIRALDAPIAFAADFLVEQPVRRRSQRLVLGISQRQRVRPDRGIPHRREAGLEEEAVAVIHHQVVEVAQRTPPAAGSSLAKPRTSSAITEYIIGG